MRTRHLKSPSSLEEGRLCATRKSERSTTNLNYFHQQAILKHLETNTKKGLPRFETAPFNTFLTVYCFTNFSVKDAAPLLTRTR
jgi:hypothetical protein